MEIRWRWALACGWQRRAALPGGSEPAAARQNQAAEHETTGKRHQNKEERQGVSPSCSKRKEKRQRGRSTARAALRFGFLGGGGVEERRSSGEWYGLERCSGGAFYRSRRGRKGGARGGGVAHRRPPLTARWSFGGRPGGGVSGVGRWRGGRVNASARHWGRGGGAGAREMAGLWRRGAAMGWRSAGGRSGTTLTGGSRPSVRG
jgi:hypothetical protein